VSEAHIQVSPPKILICGILILLMSLCGRISLRSLLQLVEHVDHGKIAMWIRLTYYVVYKDLFVLVS